MKKEYNFENAKRGPVVPAKGKTRITMYLDTDILEDFRERADKTGYGYQTMINEALREYLSKPEAVAKTPVELNRPRRDQFNMIFGSSTFSVDLI